ncbi:MAG: glycoside hydrolase family 20 zincin-like fold domain-containing protein, partial [Bacteroidales bacterium]|nr:glycoside hydrolase family 20 zincin-like fold domain-containing protein [Bacteroidales bacterium]
MQKIALSVLIISILSVSCKMNTPSFNTVGIISTANHAQVDFAIEELKTALTTKGVEFLNESIEDCDLVIEFLLNNDLGYEAYETKYHDGKITLTGGDANGLMYGGLQLSDYLALGKDLNKISEIKGQPYLKKRGLRHNIPLDARTPSYDDTGDAAQHNIATMWDFGYWKNYLDNMARNRFNLLTFWNLHPYPSWVKVPSYPDVALDNVCVYNKDVTYKTPMKWHGCDIQNPENLTIVKEISIDEKIEFWKKVFTYAADRGVEIYLFHWNVFVNGADDKYGITWAQDNPVTVDYIRKSVKQMLLTYPNIKGIGVTAGEHVNRNLTGEYGIENWMWKTYGQGVMDAKAVNPELDVRFIFRRHWSDLPTINEAFKTYEGAFETSFKYSRARMYSSTKPPWFDKIYRDTVEKYGMKCWLNVRNDDIFTFRWGDPEYASQYVKNIPYELTPGFYIGPDGYVWGHESVSKNRNSRRQYDMEKHWYRFMIWGHSTYNPNLSSNYWKDKLKLRFPGTNVELLYNTWTKTSDIISWVDKIHFQQNDAQFSPEGCMNKKQFHSINKFIWIGEMPEQGVSGIAEFVLEKADKTHLTPFDVADSLEAAGEAILANTPKINYEQNSELEETVNDLVALGYLGKYYAEKVRASTFVALYRKNGIQEDKTKAIAHAEKSVEIWNSYKDAALKQYQPTLYARTMMLDWNALADSTLRDVEIAKNAKHGTPVNHGNNFLWKRDRRR